MRKLILAFLLISSTLCTIAAENPVIFPVPQHMQLTTGQFTIAKELSIVVPVNATAKDISLAQLLVAEFSDKYGMDVRIEKRNDVPANRKVMVMGAFTNVLIKKYFSDNKLPLTASNPGREGYLLRVTPTAVVIGGSDEAGAFYGFQSLRQLLEAGNGKTIQCMNVKDWPSLPVRAIRLYVPGPENIIFFKRFMKNFMSLYKYNKVVMEFNCMRLDKHPEVNSGWEAFGRYMTYSRSTETLGTHGETKNSSHYDAGDGFILEKDAVRDLVKFANDSYIEVIPEIPSLSHVYYLLANHPELAEYPGDQWPDTYCPSNPASYKLLFDVYDEYIEVLKPKMVHVGHDEWRGAPIDVCPLCKGKNYSELYAGDVNKIHDYLSKKGIKMAMWGDFLLEDVRGKGPQEKISSTNTKYLLPGALSPELVRKSIPKDILVFNWFWDGKDNNKDKQVNDFGFKQFYGNLEPAMYNWEKRTKEFKAQGGGPSSWTATNEYSFGKDLILDYLGCANMLWSGKFIEKPELAKIVWARIPGIRAGIRDKMPPSEEENKMEPVDISAHFNVSKEAKDLNVDLSNLTSGEINNRSMLFNLPAASGNCAVAVSAQGAGSTSFPDHVEGIKINEDVSSLIFLQTCAKPGVNLRSYFNIPDIFDSPDLLGWYEVVYEDGLKINVPIQYGVNVLEWNANNKPKADSITYAGSPSQDMYCYEANAVDGSKNGSNNFNTFAFEWVNKRLGKVIKEVNFHGSVNYQSLRSEYETPLFQPMPSNAVLLLAISKVKKREKIKPY